MKAQDSNPNDAALSRVLQQLKVQAPLPPRFEEAVWRQIERGESQAPGWLTMVARFLAALARPSLASSYLAVLLLAGLLAGYWQARAANAHAEAQLSARYVQMIDPYQNPTH